MENIPDIPTKTIIVVACVCAAVILVLVAVLLYFCCKRRHPRKSDFEANPAHSQFRYYNEVLPMQCLLDGREQEDTCSSVSQEASHLRPTLATVSRRRPQAMTVQYPADPTHTDSNSLTAGKPYAMVPPSGYHDSPPATERQDSVTKPVFATSQSSKDPLLASLGGDSDPPSPRRLVTSFSSGGLSSEAGRLLSPVSAPQLPGIDNHSVDLQMTPLTADGRTMSPTPNGDGVGKPRKVIYEVVV